MLQYSDMTCGSPYRYAYTVLIGLSAYFVVSIPVLLRKIPRSSYDSTHLLCRCMLHLLSLSLKQAEDPTWWHKYHPLNNFLHSKMTLNPNEVLHVLPRYVSMFEPFVQD